MGLEEGTPVYVLTFDLDGREQIFKAYKDASKKTERRAKKHARIKTKQYGTLFRAKIMLLEGDNNDGQERTDNTVQREEVRVGTGEVAGDQRPADTDAGDGGGGLLRGLGRSGDNSDLDRIERLKRPAFTEENYKAGLVGITPENIKAFDQSLGLPEKTEAEYEERAARIIAGHEHPFPVRPEGFDAGDAGSGLELSEEQRRLAQITGERGPFTIRESGDASE